MVVRNPRIGTQRKQSTDSFSATVTSGASGGTMERLKGDAVARCRTRVKVPIHMTNWLLKPAICRKPSRYHSEHPFVGIISREYHSSITTRCWL